VVTGALARYLKLAWNLIPYKIPRCFGLPLEVKKALRLQRSMQTKDNLMEHLDLVDMFVQMKAIECQIKGIISQSIQELKLERIVQSA
jgi:hypothetical protein